MLVSQNVFPQDVLDEIRAFAVLGSRNLIQSFHERRVHANRDRRVRILEPFDAFAEPDIFGLIPSQKFFAFSEFLRISLWFRA